MTASLIPTPVMQFFDSNGDPLVGGKVYTYAAGTSTPLATYTDQGGATPNANPVILDSRGEAAIWFGGSSYKLVLKTSVDVLIWTADNVTAALAALAASSGSSLVGFLPAGTSAVATTAQAKMRESVSVFDFMTAAQVADVVGNIGSLDVTAAGTAAIATGKSVFWPQGTYKVSPIGAAGTGTLTGLVPAEPNRTSLWKLATNQRMYGEGQGTKLIWGTPGTKQYFFAVTTATNTGVYDMYMSGSYGTVAIDPVSDGAVDTFTMRGITTNDMLLDFSGGRQLAIYTDSHTSRNINVLDCNFTNGANHAILLCNSDNAKVSRCDFLNFTNGFCVDSNSCRGVIIDSNTGYNVKYFCKDESSLQAPNTAEQCVGPDFTVTNNRINKISSWGVYLNSAGKNCVISNNVLTDVLLIGIYYDAVSNYTHTGTVVTSGNVIVGNNTVGSVGIRDGMASGAKGHVYEGNIIDNVITGYDFTLRTSANISGGMVNSAGAGIQVDSAAVIDGFSVDGVDIHSGGTCLSVLNSTTTKRVKITNNHLNFGSGASIYTGTSPCAMWTVTGNQCHGTGTPISGMYLKTVSSSLIANNIINTPTAVVISGLDMKTATTDCMISNNVTTKALNIEGGAGTTVSPNNIIAAYVA